MNGFSRHGIEHSSPSQINTWISSPSKWVAEKLFGYKGSTSPAMWRGIAVEEAVKAVIFHGQSIGDALKGAYGTFDRKTAFGHAEARQREREAIAPMLDLAVEALAPYGTPDFAEGGGQHGISLTAKGDGWELPVTGFIDFKFPEHGLVVDLKTTMRMPTEMSHEHQRQRAIYHRALGNHAVKFLYVTPKKAEMLEDGDCNKIMAEVKAHLVRQERFLNLGDKTLLASIVPVDPSDFRWKGDEHARFELFGI